MKLSKNAITVSVVIELSVEKVWQYWTTAADIREWNNPSDEWHSSIVNIDLRPGGKFLFRMETKDGRVGFDHSGVYDTVIPNQLIEYTVYGGRRSVISFKKEDNTTILMEVFEPEPSIPANEQEEFCRAIVENFKQYVENKNQANA